MRPTVFLFFLVRKERRCRARYQKEKIARRGQVFSVSKPFTRGYRTYILSGQRDYAFVAHPSAKGFATLAPLPGCIIFPCVTLSAGEESFLSVRPIRSFAYAQNDKAKRHMSNAAPSADGCAIKLFYF